MAGFDSRDYEWGDITVIIGGHDVLSIRGVKHSTKAEKEPVYGKGRKPLYIGTGNFAYEGEFTMLKKDYDVLCDAGNGSILGLVVDSLVGYGNPSTGNANRTNRIVGLQFTEESEEIKQGDKFEEVTIPWMALDILKNI